MILTDLFSIPVLCISQSASCRWLWSKIWSKIYFSVFGVQDLVKVLSFSFCPYFGVQDLVRVFICLFSNIYEEVIQSAMTKRCFGVDFHSCARSLFGTPYWSLFGHLQLGEVDQQQCERVQGQPLDVCQVNHLKLYSHTLLIFSFLSTSPRHKLTKTKTKKIVQNGDFFSQ